ncbi:hypothetical protein LCGC14_0921760 [marine sediment metagenome]|uniref:Helix-turn-helix domain-containing protein n=1 Tax=marine sediment metagenome TaxID=412755 RepID=A0A0F9R9F3_9ZZZZ
MVTATAEQVAQRKAPIHTSTNIPIVNTERLLESLTYGVPPQRRIITAGVFRKRLDLIRDCLMSLGYPTWRRSIILELVRLYAYYGKVYPKASHIAEDAYCSKRTFWRAVQQLEQDGLIERSNRFLHHLQISNCYRLDKLILILTRYITEHAEHQFAEHAPDFLFQTGKVFWTLIWTMRVRLRDPVPITAMA